MKKIGVTFLIIFVILFCFTIIKQDFIVNDDKNSDTIQNKDVITNNSDVQNKNVIENEEMKEFINDEIFADYYEEAIEKLKTLTIDEKIGQLFLVRLPSTNELEALKQYQFSGYIFYEKDFKGKTKDDVKRKIDELNAVSNIPLLIAVDEEGGTVVRVSSNKNLSEHKFESPIELYEKGEFEAIREDTIEKSNVLSDLGINLNLAPVVDVCTDSNNYMYKRTLGKGEELTSIYAETVISASKENNVSYTLKHFPGYGNNIDTHKGSSIDNRSFDDILNNDLPPFRAGIEAGAEAILISHNIVTSIDKDNPASLSKKVHDLLRNELSFTGVIITDDLDMGAVSNDKDATVKAVLAGNNLIITTDYKNSIASVKEAIKQGEISEKLIDELILKVLEWKYYKKMI